MPKTSTPVDKQLLVKCVKDVDGPTGIEGGLTALYKKVADLYNSKDTSGNKAITFSIVMLRIAEWGIPVNTKPGKRGVGAGSPERIAAMRAGRSENPRKSKKEKFAKFYSVFDDMRKLFSYHKADLHLPIIDRIEAGSMKAAIKAKCLECTCFQMSEIKRCNITSCPLWPFRPYQASPVEEEGKNEN